MLVVGHDHGNMAVGSIVLSVVPIGKLIGTRKSEFAGTPPLPWSAEFSHPPLKFGILLFRTEGYPNSCLDTFIQDKRQPKLYTAV